MGGNVCLFVYFRVYGLRHRVNDVRVLCIVSCEGTGEKVRDYRSKFNCSQVHLNAIGCNSSGESCDSGRVGPTTLRRLKEINCPRVTRLRWAATHCLFCPPIRNKAMARQYYSAAPSTTLIGLEILVEYNRPLPAIAQFPQTSRHGHL